ncbi:MAG: hypothetical protein KO464_04760 [Candidatus Methanofastidiosum sp.]|nr:hypothetical protein [Methanofastidiosum sp.]
MNYRLLLGCISVGSGLSLLYYRFTNAIYFTFFEIVLLAMSLFIGVFLIVKGRQESRQIKE